MSSRPRAGQPCTPGERPQGPLARAEGARVVAVSPHLDDAVFSAGGLLARLVDVGASVGVVTCFTGSVAPADCSPFALSTQLDKGLDAEVDYMALRRIEDADALAVLGVGGRHLGLLEAPHRGYTSAAGLFGRRRADDTVAGSLAEALAALVVGADLLLAPQAVGDHVDHQVVVTVVARLAADGVLDPDRLAWWRDAPYALRRPDAPAAPEVRGATVSVDLAGVLDRKTRAARCYRTQVGFQFGGADAVGPALTTLAVAEGDRHGIDGPVEVVRAGPAAASILDVAGGRPAREDGAVIPRATGW